MLEDTPVVYSIGHSRHPMETFLSLLRTHGIRVLVDVRGQPWSRHNPQYNRRRLETSLEASGISYSWRGDYLSGRPVAREFYGPNGEVLWDRLRAWPALHRALDELVVEIETRRMAIMCAEEDPNRCHRRLLLTPLLVERRTAVRHIRGNGRLEDEDKPGTGDGPAQFSLFP